jgi:hypothetical protein
MHQPWFGASTSGDTEATRRKHSDDVLGGWDVKSEQNAEESPDGYDVLTTREKLLKSAA